MEPDPIVPREGTKMDAADVRQNFVALKEEIGAIPCRADLPKTIAKLNELIQALRR